MQSLEVSGAVRPLQWSLGVKGLIDTNLCKPDDGQTRSKHVTDVTSYRITVNCVV